MVRAFCNTNHVFNFLCVLHVTQSSYFEMGSLVFLCQSILYHTFLPIKRGEESKISGYCGENGDFLCLRPFSIRHTGFRHRMPNRVHMFSKHIRPSKSSYTERYIYVKIVMPKCSLCEEIYSVSKKRPPTWDGAICLTCWNYSSAKYLIVQSL